MEKYFWSTAKNNNKWPEEIYKYLKDITLQPKELNSKSRVDLVCNKHGTYLKQINLMYCELNKYGYVSCPKCADQKAKEKRKITNLERYGVEHVLLNPQVKEKANKVMVEKYGSKHALQNKDNLNKFKSTMVDRYGVEYSLQNKDLHKKFIDSMNELYGVNHALHRNEFKQKMKETNLDNFGTEFASQTYKSYLQSKLSKGGIPVSEEIFNTFNDKALLTNYIDSITLQDGTKPTIRRISELSGFSETTAGKRIRDFGLHDNIHYMASESYGEQEIMNFLDNYSIKYNHRYTKLGAEIDIYLPDYNVGLEFNGLYWHNVELKGKKYHYEKMKYYKDIGIKIINIYEDEWNDSTGQDIIKSIILSSCNIYENNTIKYARKLKLVELDHSQDTLMKVRSFYDENHLQGYRQGAIHIALLDNNNNEIIECMTFGHAYFANKGNKTKYQYELIRHCTKLYHNVVGGKERIFKYLLTNYPYDSKYNNYIITYCDIDKFNGNSYIKLGFTLIDHRLQVWGIEHGYSKRINRNPSNNDYFKALPKIYGCGNNVYIYNIN